MKHRVPTLIGGAWRLPVRLGCSDPLHSAWRPQGGDIWLALLRRARMRVLVCICLCVNERMRPRLPFVVHQSWRLVTAPQKGDPWADEADKHLTWLYIRKSWLRAHIKCIKIHFLPHSRHIRALQCKTTLCLETNFKGRWQWFSCTNGLSGLHEGIQLSVFIMLLPKGLKYILISSAPKLSSSSL